MNYKRLGLHCQVLCDTKVMIVVIILDNRPREREIVAVVVG